MQSTCLLLYTNLALVIDRGETIANERCDLSVWKQLGWVKPDNDATEFA